MKTHAWKVVYKNFKGRYQSPIAVQQITYKINKTVSSPTDIGLFCFKLRRQARNFVGVSWRARIFKVEVDSNDEKPYAAEWVDGCPTGTVRYSKVKMLPIRG